MNNKIFLSIASLFLLASCGSKFTSSTAEYFNKSLPVQNFLVQPKSDNENSSNDFSSSGSNSVQFDQSIGQGVSNVGDSSLNQISDQDCYFNYVSIFEWQNADDSNAYDVAPIISSPKVTTLKIFNNVSNSTLKESLNFVPDSAWKYYFILSPGSTPGSTTVTSYLNKKDQLDSSTEMTCGFGPTFDTQSNIIKPGARIVYQNIGVGLNGIDGQSGFLSHKDKFIACKFTKGSQGVLLYGANSNYLMKKSFVIKRGCFK